MPLTSAKAADLLGLSARQTRRLARTGRIVGTSLLGRDWVFEHPLKILPPDRAPGWPRRRQGEDG